MDNCYQIPYQESTPIWFHSYGYNNEEKLVRSNELMDRREVLLRDFLPEVPQLWQLHNQAAKITPNVTIGRCVLDVKDANHHSWSYQTEKSSQVIGWFADPTRLPECKMREWRKYYRIV